MSIGGDSTIESVSDIGEVAEVEEGDLEESGVVIKTVEGKIDGVLYSDEYLDVCPVLRKLRVTMISWENVRSAEC